MVAHGNVRGSRGHMVLEGCRRCKMGHSLEGTRGAVVQIIPATSLLCVRLDISITKPLSGIHHHVNLLKLIAVNYLYRKFKLFCE